MARGVGSDKKRADRQVKKRPGDWREHLGRQTRGPGGEWREGRCPRLEEGENLRGAQTALLQNCANRGLVEQEKA